MLKLRSFREQIHVYVTGGELKTDHSFYLAGQRFLTLRYEIERSRPTPRELHPPPARKPTNESAQHEPDLGRERNVGGHLTRMPSAKPTTAPIAIAAPTLMRASLRSSRRPG